jgi:hypothetical protein
MKKHLFLTFALSLVMLSACTSVEESSEIADEAIVVTELDSILDYYQNVPSEFMAFDYGLPGLRSEDAIKTLDEENYYLELFTGGEMTLFLAADEGPLLAMEYEISGAAGLREIFFLRFVDDEWEELTDEILSAVDWDYIEPYNPYFDRLHFDLPQFGTKIEVAGLMDLYWVKGEFEVDYYVGENAIQRDFTYESVNDFSLDFPAEWTGVRSYYDFSGFGSSEESPMCIVCGRSTIFGFLDEEDDYSDLFLFEIMKISLEDKGSEYIPAEFEYLGESADAVYYGDAEMNKNLSSHYEALSQQIPEILETLQAL